MWTIVALFSALTLAPAQAGQLQLTHPRYTYGVFGQERKDSTYLPIDVVWLAFDIEGLKVKDDGTAQYSMAMSLYNNKKGKYLYQQETPKELTVTNSLGGTRQPVHAQANVLPGMEAGEYTITVTVKDLLSKATKELKRTFTVKKLEFSLVNPGFVYLRPDGAELFAPPLAVPGLNMMLHFTAIGYTEDAKGNPKVTVTVEIQDEAGKPVLKKPISGTADKYESNDYKQNKFIPFHVPIQINRSGKYKVVLSATDDLAKKKTTFPPLDLTVIEMNK